MPRVVYEKVNFSAGQIDEAARKNKDRPLYAAGCASARNYRLLNGGGAKRRAATWLRAVLANGKSVGCEYVTPDGGVFILVFSHAQLTVYDDTPSLVQTLTGQPWGSAIIDELYFDVADGKLTVCHNNFASQVISVDDAGVWSVSDFTFADSDGAGTAQPYWNYQTKGVTLTPSALTGSITLSTSGPHFDANHVGVKFRYLGREMTITTVTDDDTAAATVVQDLPPTVVVILGDSKGFLVDESVEGEDSGAKGIISAIGAVAGSGATFTATANSHSLWDGGSNIGVGAGGTGYVSGQVGLIAHYMLRGAQKMIAATTVTVVAGAITAAVFPATEEGFKPWASDVTFTISNTKLTVVMTDGLTGFLNGENLIGDGKSKSLIAVGPSNTTPAAVLDWDEQAFSAVRGYPGGCRTHRGRLYFFDFRDVPRAITGSKAGFPTYFRVGANDGDAIFELVPEYKGQRVRHLISGDQGLVVTDKAVYCMAESDNQVVTPSTWDLRFIAPVGAAKPMPVSTEQGFAFIEEGTNRIMGIISAGDNQHPWQTVDLSAFWTELMTGPRSLATDVAITGRPERYSYVVNDDGSLACCRIIGAQADVPLGWTPWDNDGAFRSIFSAGGRLFAITQFDVDGTETWGLEEFDEALYLDRALAYSGADDTVTEYAGEIVSVMLDNQFLGEFLVSSGGLLTDFDFDDDEYVVGFDMRTELDAMAPVVKHYAFIPNKRYGLPKCTVAVLDTSVYMLNGALNPAYRAGEDVNALPPLRTESKRFGVRGRGTDLSPIITQPDPSPITVLAITMEVSF
jgi:hypothetical protein